MRVAIEEEAVHHTFLASAFRERIVLSIATERAHLAKAEQDVTEGERRIAEQTELVDRLSRQGLETEQAEKLLATLKETLRAWYAHREEIRRTLAKLEDDQLRPPSTGNL